MPKFFANLLLVSSTLALSSCVYLTEQSAQHVTVNTPGAHDTHCTINNDGIHFKVDSGQSAFVKKSPNPLHVMCSAPGGREREVYINPVASSAVMFNLATGPIGPFWDVVSGAAFKYPDVVEVDFTNMELVAPGLPTHNNPDIRQPEEYQREEYGPTRPVLNGEPRFTRAALRRRAVASAEDFGTGLDDGAALAPTSNSSQSVSFPNSLTAESAPGKADVPIYPGE